MLWKCPKSFIVYLNSTTFSLKYLEIFSEDDQIFDLVNIAFALLPKIRNLG